MKLLRRKSQKAAWFACLLLAAATVAPPSAADTAATAGQARDRLLVRELVRLDERLHLATFPDGTGAWLARLAASLEHRLRRGDEDLVATDLLRRLASELRGLGGDRDLDPASRGRGGPAGTGAFAAPGVSALDPQREESLDRLLASVQRVHDKLDRAAAAATGAPRAAAFAAPVNDSCAAASVVTDGTSVGSTAEATPDGSASCDGPTPPPDVWFRYTAAADGPVVFDTFGSSFDTVLSVFEGCPGDGRDNELACNDDAGSSLQSELLLMMASGQEVWVRVGGFGGARGSYELNVGPVGTLSGAVTRDDTGEPLAGVRVGIFDGAFHIVDDAFTAADGTYFFPQLEPGTYYVRSLDTEGMVDELYDDLACPSFAYCTATNGTPIVVGSTPISGIDLALSPASRITGNLTASANGAPVAGYVVLHASTGAPLDTFVVAADGTYEIGGLPAGNYHVSTSTEDYRDEVYDDVACSLTLCVASTGDQVTVGAAATMSGIDFVLDRLSRLSGTVTDEVTGTPPAGTRLELYDSGPSYQRATYTASDGGYQFSGLLGGNYYVRTQAEYHLDEIYDDLPCLDGCDLANATPVPIVANVDTAGIDFALQPLGRVSGTVRHAVTGEPLYDVQIRILRPDGRVAGLGYSELDGSYLVRSLLPGSYHAVTRSDRYADELFDDVPCDPSCTLTDGATVDVELASTTSGVDFSLHRLGILQGTVHDPDGDSLYSFVTAYDAEGSKVATSSTATFNGFTLSGLPPGDYYVKTTVSGYYPYQDELWDDVPCDPSCDLTSGTPLTLDLDSTIVGIDFVLRRCPAASYTDVSGTTYLSMTSVEACERVTAAATTVSSGADVTFRAGRRIVLEDGFAVLDGGTFRAEIEPTWSGD